MAKKPESRLQLSIRKALEAEFGGWWKKVHGGPFQAAGIPDLIGITHKVFFAFEVKHPDEDTPVTPLQQKNIRDIRRGGGVAHVVESKEEAISIVRKALGLSTSCRRVRSR